MKDARPAPSAGTGWPAWGLTFCLLALAGAALCVPAFSVFTRPAYRRFIFLGLPLAVAAVGFLFMWLSKVPLLRRPALLGRLGTILWTALVMGAVGLNLSGVLMAYATGWTYFTYADHSLYVAMPRLLAWALPVAWVLGVCWEWTLRRVLVGLWVRGNRARLGWILAALLGLLLSAPQVVEGGRILSGAFTAAGLFRLVCMEAACTALALWGPGVLWSGLYRGLTLFFSVWALNDWYSPLFPAANYVSVDAMNHLLYSTGPAAALVWLGIASYRRNRNARSRRTEA